MGETIRQAEKEREKRSTYREKLEAYAARTHHVSFRGSSFRIAALSSAVDSTRCGQLPRCAQMDTRATASLRRDVISSGESPEEEEEELG